MNDSSWGCLGSDHIRQASALLNSGHKHQCFLFQLLSNVKEKLYWGQMEVLTLREQLSAAEASVAGRRDLLTRTRRNHSGLLRDNLRLQEHQGLLGNRVLLRDFEDTLDASEHLEEHLEALRGRRAAMVFRRPLHE